MTSEVMWWGVVTCSSWVPIGDRRRRLAELESRAEAARDPHGQGARRSGRAAQADVSLVGAGRPERRPDGRRAGHRSRARRLRARRSPAGLTLRTRPDHGARPSPRVLRLGADNPALPVTCPDDSDVVPAVQLTAAHPVDPEPRRDGRWEYREPSTIAQQPAAGRRRHALRRCDHRSRHRRGSGRRGHAQAARASSRPGVSPDPGARSPNSIASRAGHARRGDWRVVRIAGLGGPAGAAGGTAVRACGCADRRTA
jgi:hypothetical protein